MRERIINRKVNPLLDGLPTWAQTFRPHQVKAITEIMSAYDEGAKLVIVEAPTGAGKTLIGAAVALLLKERRSTYICSSKSLQDQFVRDFPYAHVIKGRANYPTARYPDRFDGTWQGLSCDDCNWSGESCDWCGVKSACPYEIAKKRAVGEGLAVANTAYYLAECNSAGRMNGRGFVIVDEADTLEGELMGYATVEISQSRMKKMGWSPPEKVTVAESWGEWVEEMTGEVGRALIEARQAADRALGDGRREAKEVRYFERLQGSLGLLKTELDNEQPWVYTGRGGVRDKDGLKVEFKPTYVNALGKELLWTHADKWLLMSATIISPEEMVSSLGWEEEYRVVSVESTFPPENRPVYPLCIVDMSKKADRKEDVGAYVRAIVDMTEHKEDRVLVHTVSYDVARIVTDALKGCGRKVFSYMNAEEREGALDAYKKKERAVLVAPSMDRGVDLPGDLCRVQIIAKVPFPYLGDRQISARMHGRGGQVWYNVQTVRTLVQMTGRGVRSNEDHAVTYVLDSQFQSMVWSKSRRLLPKWWTEAVQWRRGQEIGREIQDLVTAPPPRG